MEEEEEFFEFEEILPIGKEKVAETEGISRKKEELELKKLLEHLKYVFLGENNTKLVIISSTLSVSHKNKLVSKLKKRREAIGWCLDDIVGINPAKCMHRIDLEPNTKPVKDFQRRLNPTMEEVVKKAVLKLLDAGIIDPIANSN